MRQDRASLQLNCDLNLSNRKAREPGSVWWHCVG